MEAATANGNTLFTDYDPEPWNPRDECEPLGRMICFHRRYSLGDKHTYKSPDDFLGSLAYEQFVRQPQKLFDYIKTGKAKSVKLTYSRKTREWELCSQWHHSCEWITEAAFHPHFLTRKPEAFVDAVVNALWTEDVIALLRTVPDLVLLPIYLLDHSGLSMRTTRFNDQWDSGQVGWVYADSNMILAEYKEMNKARLSEARNLLISEVESYDRYLKGECYRYMLYQGEDEIDACSGFLDNHSGFLADLRASLPGDCKALVDQLRDVPYNSPEGYFAAHRNRRCNQ